MGLHAHSVDWQRQAAAEKQRILSKQHRAASPGNWAASDVPRANSASPAADDRQASQPILCLSDCRMMSTGGFSEHCMVI